LCNLSPGTRSINIVCSTNNIICIWLMFCDVRHMRRKAFSLHWATAAYRFPFFNIFPMLPLSPIEANKVRFILEAAGSLSNPY